MHARVRVVKILIIALVGLINGPKFSLYKLQIFVLLFLVGSLSPLQCAKGVGLRVRNPIFPLFTRIPTALWPLHHLQANSDSKCPCKWGILGAFCIMWLWRDLLQSCWGLFLLYCIHCLENGSGLSEHVKVLQLFYCVWRWDKWNLCKFLWPSFVAQSMKRILFVDKLVACPIIYIPFYISKIETNMSRVTTSSNLFKP
jgi:hypothetical protein